MKTAKLFIALILLTGFIMAQEALEIEWARCYGGTNGEGANSIIQTSDGNFIIAGTSFSNDCDVSGHHGPDTTEDYWIVKIDSVGDILWQKSLGGSRDDDAYSVRETFDGGFVVAGFCFSNDCDVSGNHGWNDYWIIKLDYDGNIVWQKCFGGSRSDKAYDIQETSDGGYIVAGSSNSNDVDVTDNHGDYDYWIVKLDSCGDILWQNSLGGSEDDIASSVQETSIGEYIVAGYSYSNDGDVTDNHGSFDYWVVKLNSHGNLIWQKSLGGSSGDIANSILEATAGGFIVAGSSNSNDVDVTGNHGSSDFWIVKLDYDGYLSWQKSFGGTYGEEPYAIQNTSDSGFVIVGYNNSFDGDLTHNHGRSDYCITKLDSIGNVIWQKSLGGSEDDIASSVQETSDGGFVVAGRSMSIDADVSGNHGRIDYWILKLSPEGSSISEPSPPLDQIQSTPQDFTLTSYPNPFNSTLNITLPPNARSLEIADINGKTVHFSSITSQTSYSWSPSDGMASGVYKVKVKTNETEITSKVVYIK